MFLLLLREHVHFLFRGIDHPLVLQDLCGSQPLLGVLLKHALEKADGLF